MSNESENEEQKKTEPKSETGLWMVWTCDIENRSYPTERYFDDYAEAQRWCDANQAMRDSKYAKCLDSYSTNDEPIPVNLEKGSLEEYCADHECGLVKCDECGRDYPYNTEAYDAEGNEQIPPCTICHTGADESFELKESETIERWVEERTRLEAEEEAKKPKKKKRFGLF